MTPNCTFKRTFCLTHLVWSCFYGATVNQAYNVGRLCLSTASTGTRCHFSEGWCTSLLGTSGKTVTRKTVTWPVDWERLPNTLACQKSWHDAARFFRLGFVKDQVFKTPVDDIDELKRRIRGVVGRVDVNLLTNTWRELRRRLEFLRENNNEMVNITKFSNEECFFLSSSIAVQY